MDRGGESKEIGRALLDQVKQVFALWHQVRDGALNRTGLQEAVAPVQQRVKEALRAGTRAEHSKTRKTCANILKIERSLWTFVRVEGVGPTNNDAERPLRRAVLWRRKSFGTQSAAGSRFVERILTAVTSLRQQKRDVLAYLAGVCAAARSAVHPYGLIPDSL